MSTQRSTRQGLRTLSIVVTAGVIAMVVLAAGIIIFSGRSHQTLRIATTTSLDDSGLLDEILPDFESEHDATAEVIAVGTGQALVLGERGDVDVVLVHAPGLEQDFVDNGYGVVRTTVMTNPFIIVGPSDDPAGVADAESTGDALVRIAEAETPFVSRGDDSGTHTKELEVWATTTIQPTPSDSWYHAAGQGMGETLLTANELIAYTLTDRATFVTIDDDQVADLVPLYGAPNGPGAGDALLDNPYSVIAVNPDLHPDVASDLAQTFIECFNSESTRTKIAEYGTDSYGESLFTLLGDG